MGAFRPQFCFFFFNDTATTEIYTLSLHDALPICVGLGRADALPRHRVGVERGDTNTRYSTLRSEEHTSELQSQSNLVCRLLLEKKNYSTTRTLPTSTSSRDITQRTDSIH